MRLGRAAERLLSNKCKECAAVGPRCRRQEAALHDAGPPHAGTAPIESPIQAVWLACERRAPSPRPGAALPRPGPPHAGTAPIESPIQAVWLACERRASIPPTLLLFPSRHSVGPLLRETLRNP